jgi:hypothetical protein
VWVIGICIVVFIGLALYGARITADHEEKLRERQEAR